jgi:predicted lactoylglutathione lyase
MIGYVTLGTNNLDKAAAYYDQLFQTLNIGRFMEEAGRFVAWAPAPDQPSVAVSIPFDGQPATTGNGTMVALYVKTRAEVHKVYDRALALGGTDEGAPGTRGNPESGFYAAYFRDLDGNKLNVFCVEHAG